MPQLLIAVLVLVVLVLILIFIIVVAIMLIYSRARSCVPLIPVRKNALATILEALDMKPGDTLYDLGSGDGRVLKAALEHEPQIQTIGLEIGPWPRLVSKINLRKYGSRAQIRNQDFFKADLSEATHIYMYLYPSIIDKLEPMFDRNLSPGTRVVSCDFKFKNKVPDKIILVPKSKTLAKTIYLYTW